MPRAGNSGLLVTESSNFHKRYIVAVQMSCSYAGEYYTVMETQYGCNGIQIRIVSLSARRSHRQIIWGFSAG